MKNCNEVIQLSNDDEVSSIIYSALSTYDKFKETINICDFDPVKFVIGSMYDLEFPIYSHLDFITRRGGARYIMNDVSSYRYAKGYTVDKFITLKRLFSKYGCKNKNDVINFIINICDNPDINAYHFDEIKKAIIAYNLYYKNDIIISSWPDDNKLYKDFVFSRSFSKKKGEFLDSFVDVVDNNDTIAFTCTHNRYPDSKLLVLCNGRENIDEDSAAFDFYEELNEWFNKVNPHVSNFDEVFASFVCDANNRISEKSIKNRSFSSTSASVVIITGNNSYVLSIGDTRTYFFKDGNINRVIRDETLTESFTTSSTIPMFDDFLSTFPSSSIGYSSFVNAEFKPEIAVIPTSSIDGFLSITRDLYNGIDDKDLEVLWNTFDSSDLLKSITYQIIPSKTNGLVLYRK